MKSNKNLRLDFFVDWHRLATSHKQEEEEEAISLYASQVSHYMSKIVVLIPIYAYKSDCKKCDEWKTGGADNIYVHVSTQLYFSSSEIHD